MPKSHRCCCLGCLFLNNFFYSFKFVTILLHVCHSVYMYEKLTSVVISYRTGLSYFTAKPKYCVFHMSWLISHLAHRQKRLSTYKDILILFITNIKNKRSYYRKVPCVSCCQSYLSCVAVTELQKFWNPNRSARWMTSYEHAFDNPK